MEATFRGEYLLGTLERCEWRGPATKRDPVVGLLVIWQNVYGILRFSRNYPIQPTFDIVVSATKIYVIVV